MKTFAAIKAALVTAALLLGGCAASGPTMPPGVSAGWVVVSMAKDMGYNVAELAIKPLDNSSGLRGMGFYAMNVGATLHEFGGKKEGYVKAAQFAPGTYHIVNFKLVYAATNSVYSSKADFSVPFEVKANEITYLGEFLATGTLAKLVIFVPSPERPYFILSDQQARDMPIAVAETPQLKDLPVKKAPLAKSSATPFFRTTRIPESK